MRKKVIAGNWKMNKTLKDAEQFVDETTKYLSNHEDVYTVVCAPFPFLPALVEKAEGTHLQIGAQDMHFEDNGAFTGEVSPAMLQDLGVTHVIIGHSERRDHFAETDDAVNKKIHAAFKHKLIPILCVGETLEKRESGQTKSHIEKQIIAGLKGLTNEQIASTIIAYEPIWAIGTGKTASSAEANDVCSYIREVVKSMCSEQVADQIIIQYGGSVKPDNIDKLLSQSDIDGALAGGASLDPVAFRQLVEASTNET